MATTTISSISEKPRARRGDDCHGCLPLTGMSNNPTLFNCHHNNSDCRRAVHELRTAPRPPNFCVALSKTLIWFTNHLMLRKVGQSDAGGRVITAGHKRRPFLRWRDNRPRRYDSMSKNPKPLGSRRPDNGAAKKGKSAGAEQPTGFPLKTKLIALAVAVSVAFVLTQTWRDGPEPVAIPGNVSAT